MSRDSPVDNHKSLEDNINFEKKLLPFNKCRFYSIHDVNNDQD